jgi:hypothetical protein
MLWKVVKHNGSLATYAYFKAFKLHMTCSKGTSVDASYVPAKSAAQSSNEVGRPLEYSWNTAGTAAMTSSIIA